MAFHHQKVLKEEMKTLKKLKMIRNEDSSSIQSYMKEKSLEDSRLEFKWRTNMIDTRTTMKGKYKAGQSWCPHCRAGWVDLVKETPSHLLECEAYSSLRVGLDAELVRPDRIKFLRKAILRREELEKALKK